MEKFQMIPMSANCVTLWLTVGDSSGSESERWNLDIFEEDTGRAVYHHCDQGFGTPGSAEYALVKGKAYTFSLRWIATNLGYGPDYDWRALINDSDEAGAREGPYGTGAFIVEDPDGLLTEERHGDDTDTTVFATNLFAFHSPIFSPCVLSANRCKVSPTLECSVACPG